MLNQRSRILFDKATESGTIEWTAKFPKISYKSLGKTGLQVSQAGFGSYRIDVRSNDHIKAFRKAILSGINIIDTSSNYTNGNSERLIGSVLNDLITQKTIEREFNSHCHQRRLYTG